MYGHYINRRCGTMVIMLRAATVNGAMCCDVSYIDTMTPDQDMQQLVDGIFAALDAAIAV